MKKKAIALLLTAAMAMSMAACGAKKEEPAPAPAAPAETEKPAEEKPAEAPAEAENAAVDISGMELSILGSYHEDMVKRLAEMFEKQTGCKVSYLRMPTGEAVAKLTAEKDNPTVSVFLGGTVDGHENLKAQGILGVYHSPKEAELPAEYVDPDGVWKAQYLETLSIGVNTERWEKEFAGPLQVCLNPSF